MASINNGHVRDTRAQRTINHVIFVVREPGLNPSRAPEPLPILNPSNFVPKNGFPVVKGLRSPVLQKTVFGR